MRYRTAFAPVLLSILSACFCLNSRAQLPQHLERCLPYPPPDADSAGSEPSIAFDKIIFEDPQPSQHVQRLLMRAARSRKFWQRPQWRGDLGLGLRVILQAHGYFRADVSVRAETLSRDAQHDHVALTIRAVPGEQYSLGTIRFWSLDPDEPIIFPAEELRKLIPMRDGDTFDTGKLREGFSNLVGLYGVSGWIDFSVEPDFDIDDEAHRINLRIVLDQQCQYRIGELSFLGDNPVAERAARSTFKTGELFNVSLFKQFFVEHESILPVEDEHSTDVEKSAKTGFVNLHFDFRACPAS